MARCGPAWYGVSWDPGSVPDMTRTVSACRRAWPGVSGGQEGKAEEKGCRGHGWAAGQVAALGQGAGGGVERLGEALVPAALLGPAHVHSPKSITTLKMETNGPLLFVVLFVNRSCQFSLVLNKGELCGSHK